MKYILIFLLFISGAVVAQPVVQRSNGQNTLNDPNLAASKSFIPPVYADTTAANAPGTGLDTAGKLIISKVDTAIYIRGGIKPNLVWKKIAGGTGGGGGISFVVTDSTLTGHGTSSDSLRVNFTYVQRKLNFSQDFIYTSDSLFINWANAFALGITGSVQYRGSDTHQKGDAQLVWDSSGKILKVATNGTVNGQIIAGNNATGTFKAGGDGYFQGNNVTLEALSTGNLIKFRNNGADKIAIDQNGAISLNGLGNYGTSGQVLTSGGSGSPATWVTPTTPTLQQVTTAGDTTTNRVAVNRVVLDRTISPAVSNADSLVSFGHSIAAGANATVVDSNFVSRTGRYYTLPVSNQAVPSTVVWNAVKAQMTWINSPTHRAFTVYMAALNDIRNTNVITNRKVINKIVNGYKAMWLNHFADTTIAASAGTVTRSGSWNINWDATIEGGKKTNAAYTGSPGAYIEWSTVDSSVAIQFMGNNTGGCNAVQISVDGVVQQTIDLNNRNDGIGNSYIPTAFIYTGLSFGTHTIRATNTNGSGLMIVDYFTSLRPVATAPAFMIYHDPHMDATGYAGGQASDARIDTVNLKVDSMIATLPNPWNSLRTKVALTENYYVANTSSGLSSDHIHPNDLGHGQIFNAGKAAISSSVVPDGTLQGGTDGSPYYNGRKLAFFSDLGWQSVLNNSSLLTGPNTVNGSNNTFSWTNFSRINILSTKFLPNLTSTSGQIAVTGSGATLSWASRSGDTTKGFALYASPGISSFYDGYNNRDYQRTDTSFRTAIFNNAVTSSFSLPTATVHIGGNTNGVAAHAPLKIGVGALMTTPEKDAIEYTGDDWFATDSSTRSAANENRRKIETLKTNYYISTSTTATTLFSIPIPTGKLMECEFTIMGLDGSGNTAYMRRLIRAVNIAGTVTIKGGTPIGTWTDSFDAGIGSPAITATVTGTSVNIQITPGNANSTTWTSVRGALRIIP